MRKEAVKVTPGDIVAPGAMAAPKARRATAAPAEGRAKPKPAPAQPTPAAAPAAAAPAGGTGAAPAAEAPDPGQARRNFFRLDVFDVSVHFELESIGDKAPAKPVTVKGRLADVSAGGLRLAADAEAGAMPEWPVQADVCGHLAFSLLEEEPSFDLPGRLVRRIETTSGYELAFSWDDPPQPEIDRLVHDLYQLEVRRRAAIPDDRRAKKPQARAGHSGAGRRQPVLIGAALGLAAAVAVYETVALPAVAPVLGVTAVILAAAYLLVGA